jgi:hypothetical protein
VAGGDEGGDRLGGTEVQEPGSILRRRVEQAAIEPGARRDRGKKSRRQRLHPFRVGVSGGDQPDAGGGGARHPAHALQRLEGRSRRRDPLEPALHEGVAEAGRMRRDLCRAGEAGRAGGGAHRARRVEIDAAPARGAQGRGTAGAERPAPRVLEIDHRGAGAERQGRLLRRGDAREQQRPRSD